MKVITAANIVTKKMKDVCQDNVDWWPKVENTDNSQIITYIQGNSDSGE